MKIPFEDFEIRQCTADDFEDILKLQNDILPTLPSEDILRVNTNEMLMECLGEPHYTIGAWYKGELAAITVLYVPHDEAEDLSLYLDGVDLTGQKAVNYKLCIVAKKFQGNSLQYKLGLIVEEYAKKMGATLLCATVSPFNEYSINNILKLGFKLNKTLQKYGYSRNLYYKNL